MLGMSEDAWRIVLAILIYFAVVGFIFAGAAILRGCGP